MATRTQTRRARQLRRDRTPPERKLWAILRTEPFKPFHLRRQAPIGGWFADFLSHRAKLVIEIDGDTHLPGSDCARDAALQKLGFETLRFWNSDVWEDAGGVAERILYELTLRYAPPRPSPEGRGR